jgi:hypothetical protein
MNLLGMYRRFGVVPQGLVVLFPFVPGGDFRSPLLVVFLVSFLEGPKRRTREGGSEWEPIKILFKNSAYESKFTRAPPQASLAKFT